MPSKKKKFNARFPPARIKKIMQKDEEVGKVAATVPVIISRALELFIEGLIVKASEKANEKNAKTLSASHIKQTIYNEKKFDFLRDLVSAVPDHTADDDGDDNGATRKPRVPRPRKNKDEKTPGKRKRRKESSEDSSIDNGDGENEEDDDEETETDEENEHLEASSPTGGAGPSSMSSPPMDFPPHPAHRPPFGFNNNAFNPYMPPQYMVPPEMRAAGIHPGFPPPNMHLPPNTHSSGEPDTHPDTRSSTAQSAGTSAASTGKTTPGMHTSPPGLMPTTAGMSHNHSGMPHVPPGAPHAPPGMPHAPPGMFPHMAPGFFPPGMRHPGMMGPAPNGPPGMMGPTPNGPSVSCYPRMAPQNSNNEDDDYDS